MNMSQQLFQQVMTRFPQEMASLTAIQGLNIINQVAAEATPEDQIETLYQKVVMVSGSIV
jgi:hypothetical protein